MVLNRNPLTVVDTNTVIDISWGNSIITPINNLLGNVVSYDDLNTNVVMPAYYLVGFTPTWIDNRTVSISNGVCKDRANQSAIITNTLSTNLNFSIGGSNGIAQSGFLGGSVSVSINTNTITGNSNIPFTSDFIPGDVINISGMGQGLQVQSITDNQHLVTVTPAIRTVTNVQYQRGGLAPQTWYYLHVGINSASTFFTFASTRCSALGILPVDIPFNATIYRQLKTPFVTDLSNNVRSCSSVTNFAEVYYTRYNDTNQLSNGTMNVGTNNLVYNICGTAGVVTRQSTLNLIPPIAKFGIFNFTNITTSGGTSSFGVRPSYNAGYNSLILNAPGNEVRTVEIATDTYSIECQKIVGSGALAIDVVGYVVNGVF